VPLLLRFPDGLGMLARCGRLISHADLLPTLAAWIESGEQSDSPQRDGISILPLLSNANAAWRDAVLSASATGASLRTAAWCLRQAKALSATDYESTGTCQPAELFVRPDDRWEANDVAKLCPDVVELLADAAGQACQQLQQNQPVDTTILNGS
jgi:arylsulfatase A-like enzyme